ncbi:hypothetical protein J6590_062278 [Homalodisca vitripennis]|nr:hypothetical protein J6590_062278 [Homalodisca vitripennis]
MAETQGPRTGNRATSWRSQSISCPSNPGRDRVSNPSGCQGRTTSETAGPSRDMARGGSLPAREASLAGRILPPQRGGWMSSGENPGGSPGRKGPRTLATSGQPEEASSVPWHFPPTLRVVSHSEE